MDGGKLEDLGMCLETSYPEILFDVLANPTRAMSGRPSIALQPLARKTRRGGLKQQFVTLEVLALEGRKKKTMLASEACKEN